jgi:hypothetical protein
VNYAFINHFQDVARGHLRCVASSDSTAKRGFAPNMT